jgi:hypothetical protein
MSPARAQQYPPQPASLEASAQAVVPGGPVTFTAEGFGANTTVTFTLFSTPVELGKALANANGVATLTARIPLDTPLGNHTVKATGVDPQGRPLTVSVPLVVASRVENGRAVFARTGSSNAAPIARAGVAAVAVGALLALVARKRRAGATAV